MISMCIVVAGIPLCTLLLRNVKSVNQLGLDDSNSKVCSKQLYSKPEETSTNASVTTSDTQIQTD